MPRFQQCYDISRDSLLIEIEVEGLWLHTTRWPRLRLLSSFLRMWWSIKR